MLLPGAGRSRTSGTWGQRWSSGEPRRQLRSLSPGEEAAFRKLSSVQETEGPRDKGPWTKAIDCQGKFFLNCGNKPRGQRVKGRAEIVSRADWPRGGGHFGP